MKQILHPEYFTRLQYITLAKIALKEKVEVGPNFVTLLYDLTTVGYEMISAFKPLLLL